MKSEYTPDELLPISGIQHFCFCRRQWALIYVERQWQDNVLTVDGKLMHRRVDDPFFSEIRKGVVISRSMPVASYRLGFIGVCDAVEFAPSPDGIHLQGRQGLFLPAPVEYKHGKEKQDRCDEAQLCTQVICLEEMLSVRIPYGYLFYGETRHRVQVAITPDLRNYVASASDEMHMYFERGYTPHVKPSKACRSCSLKDLCLPELEGKTITASEYIRMQIDGA